MEMKINLTNELRPCFYLEVTEERCYSSKLENIIVHKVKQKALFHNWSLWDGVNSKPKALIECKDGKMKIVDYNDIQFVDDPMSDIDYGF